MGQNYYFDFFDSVGAALAGVSHYQLHTDVDAICKAADEVAKLAARLEVPAPPPHLYGMTYTQVSTLGVKVINGPDLMEPCTEPCIHSPADIDNLHEPEDYMASGIVPQRLELVRRLKQVRPDAGSGIGHDLEGPVTNAVLMMGSDFFMLPCDDPARAHGLLSFCTQSALNYAKAIRKHQGRPVSNESEWMPDDFAGYFAPEQFKEFVAPYWAQVYEGLGGQKRSLHSELLREGHLPSLEELKIDSYDPSVNQHLPPDVLARSCRVPYGLRIWPSVLQELSEQELLDKYRYLTSFGTQFIIFHMEHPDQEKKIAALLQVARQLE